jgi:hypothetical protein
MMKPISLEVITRMITTLGQCRHCEIFFGEAGLNKKVYQEEKDEYPPEILEESERLSCWIKELKNLYRHRLSIKLIDAKSIAGIYKSLRHRIRKYPTFIIDGKKTYSGWDKNQLEDLLDQGLKAF